MSEVKYLDRVEIKGLWGRYNVNWKLNPDVNILAGINGSGKSTILNAVSLPFDVFGKSDNQSDRAEFQSGEKIREGKFYFDGDYFSVKLDVLDKGFDRARDILDTGIIEVRADEGYGHFKLKIEADETVVYSLRLEGIGYDRGFKSIISLDKVNTFELPLKSDENIRSLTKKEIRTDLDWEIYSLQDSYKSHLLKLGEKLQNKIEEEEEGTAKELKAKVYAQNTLFIEKINSHFSETGKSFELNDKKEIVFRIKGKKEDTIITPYELSSGEKQLLIIFLKALIQDNKPCIFLLDEPEVSMHTDWQMGLIKNIRELNPNAQVIIATHSPAIIMEGWLDKVTQVEDIIEEVE